MRIAGVTRGHRLPEARCQDRVLSAWRVAPLLVAAVAVIAGMLVMADRARQDADRARRAQVAIEQIHTAAERLAAVTWESLVTVRGAPPAAVVAEGVQVYRDFSASLRQLSRLGVPHARLTRIENLLGKTYTAGLRATTVARAGDVPESRRVAIRVLAPVIDDLNTAVADVSLTQGRLAQEAQQRTRLGVAGSLAAAVAALLLLVWRLQRMAKAARAESKRGEQRLRALMQHSSDVVLIVDWSGTVAWLGGPVDDVIGHPGSRIIGRSLATFVHQDDAERLHDLIRGSAGGSPSRARLRVLADGGVRHLEAIASDRRSDPDVAGILVNLRDATEHVTLEDQLRHTASHDSLTGLPGRALFEERVDRALVRMRRGASPAAVIYLDLDGFKGINDSLGHHAGDVLLGTVATRLRGALREQDTPARLGGDEFAALLEDLAEPEAGRAVAERVRLAIAEPIDLDGTGCTPRASVGIAFARPGMTTEELVRRADAAMYQAKQRSDLRVVTYENQRSLPVVDQVPLGRAGRR